tara:strand:+ start:52 stop:591 length:540 start_codon:yes stop_codon:yes gene_type:complete
MKITNKHIQPIIDWCYKGDNLKLSPSLISLKDHKGEVWGFPKLNETPLKLSSTSFPYSELAEIEHEILSKYRFKDYYREEKFGNILSFSKAGHQVHEHSDPAMMGNKYIHTRINVFISKPEEGGLAIINGDIIDVDELETWVCLASEYLHSTTMVKGIKDRIVLSFGYNINRNELEEWL